MKMKSIDSTTEEGEVITAAECRQGFHAVVRHEGVEFEAYLRGGYVRPTDRKTKIRSMTHWGLVRVVRKI